MKILVTGANGFIGTALCSFLARENYQVVRVVRNPSSPSETLIGDFHEQTDWSLALNQGIDVVVHSAGQIPLKEAGTDDHANFYHRVNAAATANLARQCAKHGVKRLIFVSTVKVLGEGKNEPYGDADITAPADAYAISKWEAEQELWQIAAETGMQIVVLRCPLVYGPEVKGNFLRLMQAIDNGVPLPFGTVQNRRSLIYLGNLVDIVNLCLAHEKAAGKTFMVSDGDDVSTTELVRRIGAALGRRPFLLPFPVLWLQWIGRLLGKQATVERLIGSLTVDINALQRELGWRPPYTLQAGLEATAKWYRTTTNM